MNRTVSLATSALIMILALGFLLLNANSGIAQYQTPTDFIDTRQTSLPPDRGDNLILGNHHREFKFSLALGESRSFNLPKLDCPVRVEISVTNMVCVRDNGVTASVPLLVRGTFVYDSTQQTLGIYGTFNASPGDFLVDGDQNFCYRAELLANVDTGILKVTSRRISDGAQSERANYCLSFWY
jgi:hypothetical protein